MKYLKELCNVYWARPENAYGIARCMQLLDGMDLKSRSLDLMCGHGIWSFIKAGGDFDYDFDCYQDVVQLDQYKKIIPCGIKDKGVTNLVNIRDNDYSNLDDLLIEKFISNLKI